MPSRRKPDTDLKYVKLYEMQVVPQGKRRLDPLMRAGIPGGRRPPGQASLSAEAAYWFDIP